MQQERTYDVTIGLWFVGVGLFIAVIVSGYFAFTSHDLSLMALVFPSTLILLGLFLVLFDFIEESLSLTRDLLNLPALVEDDLDALRHRYFTRTHMMVVGVPVLLAIQGYLIAVHDKWTANWGGVNVMLVGVLVGIVGAVMLLRTQWFHYREFRTPNWIIIAVLIGFVLSAGLGIYYTEPLDDSDGSAYDDPTYESAGARAPQTYNYQNTRAYRIRGGNWYWFDDGWLSSGSCDGDDCLFVVLVVVIIIVVVASFLIPHFWVVGTSLMITIFAIQTLRELLFVDKRPADRSPKKKKGIPIS